jgi:Cu2+-exporting ATPase
MQISLEESAPADLPGLSVWDEAQEWSRFSQTSPDEGAVFKAADGLWESQLLVRGMHCAACSLVLEQALLAKPGVLSVKVSAASQRASVVWSASQTRPSQWLGAPRTLGYTLSPALDTVVSDQARRDARVISRQGHLCVSGQEGQ